MPDGTTPPATIAALLGLTFATGIIDAASVLGPGRVFTANMTGNVVFLGFALAGRGTTSIVRGLVALGAFLGGAAIGGRVGSGGRSAAARRGMVLEISALAAATALAWIASSSAVLAIVALLALAMGLRNAMVRTLAVADLTTTVLTLTLTGIAADWSIATGTSPRWRRRAAAAILMLAGAFVGACILQLGLSAALGLALAVEIGSAALLLRGTFEPAASRSL
jgi:uncharacterized membrane protein YoaK (UPF0700 family)